MIVSSLTICSHHRRNVQLDRIWRTLPRDHAPGALLVNEAGGAAMRLDRTPYRPGTPGRGLLVSSASSAWPAVNTSLFASGGP